MGCASSLHGQLAALQVPLWDIMPFLFVFVQAVRLFALHWFLASVQTSWKFSLAQTFAL